MFKILIVDDEKIERNGIGLLIKMNQYPLEVAEAASGEEALAYLKENPVDILFTDIKMPFMDGLQLAEAAKRLHPNLKVIIFSAYGEFDYAQKAIKTNVMGYILKPVDVEEFKALMEKVIGICADEEKEEEKSKEIIEGYLRGIEYEKSRLLLDIINGNREAAALEIRAKSFGIDFSLVRTVLLLFDFNERFFNLHNDAFMEFLKNLIPTDYEYLNLNENQSMLFLKYHDGQPEHHFAENLAKDLQKAVEQKYGIKANLFFSHPVCNLREVCVQYGKIENALDNKFFYDEGSVVYVSDSQPRTALSNASVERILKDITGAIASDDFIYAAEGIDRLFDYFKVNKCLSSFFVKYICADIVKKIYDKQNKGSQDFMCSLDRIFMNNNMAELKERLIQVISCVRYDNAENMEDSGKTVMKKVMEIIEKEYMNDISLEYIAEKVYLTPSYLSYLFKKESSQSLFKFITLYRLNAAKELLMKTNMKIVDVGERVGYPNVSYFCLIFKNHFGLSPAKFREESGKK